MITLRLALKALRAALTLACLVCTKVQAQDVANAVAQSSRFAALDAAAGEALFERLWVTAPASTTSADGLGPYYNARSCAACHPGGGGGSATDQLNFIIDDPVYGELLQVRAIAGLPAEAVVIVTDAYAGTVALADGRSIPLRRPVAQVSALQHGELLSAVSIRRAPSLRGLALLAQVSEQQLLARADAADADGDGISGRLTLVAGSDGETRPGRFGWKATAASLEEQISRALSLDLGLGTPLLPSAAGDCTPAQFACWRSAAADGAEPEVSDQMFKLLLTYLQALAPPPSGPGGGGAQTFTELGCAQCHVAELEGPQGTLRPWSDLLLHDMGPHLADPLDTAPSPEIAGAAEWRTAPLWGLASVERYLHDGRATTLEEAILWHGGEAQTSATAFRELNDAETERLLAWLRTL